jgi:hypothetical protein
MTDARAHLFRHSLRAAPGVVDVQRVAVGKVLLIALAGYAVVIAGNVAASFLTDWTGVESWLVAPAVGLLVALATALIEAYGLKERTPTGIPPHPVPGDPPYGLQRRGTPLGIAIIGVVLLVGVGGLFLAQGLRYAVGYITGNEPGVDRMVGSPQSGSVDGLKLTVESVEYTSHFTRIGVVATNESDSSAQLPLFQNCIFQGLDGTTLRADAFRSKWSEELPPGSRQSGTLVFTGHLPDSVRRAMLSFSTIFGPFILESGADSSIQVRNIRLGRPGA